MKILLLEDELMLNSAISEYLKNIENIPKEKLISDLEQVNIIAKSKVPREFVEFVHFSA